MGALVIVHNKTDQPLFYKGISLSSGTQANIQITREFSEHLESPYSDCTKDISTDYPSEYVQALLKTNYTYHQSTCFNMCFQKYLIQECDCYDLSGSYFNYYTNNSPCLNFSQILCDSDAYVKFFDQDVTSICGNLCPLECEFITYALDTSYADYPSEVKKKSNQF
jgi:hypothetical protein